MIFILALLRSLIKGYEVHRKLRDQFLRFWNINKDLKDFVDYNIEQIKHQS
jgi:hypothetical protein